MHTIGDGLPVRGLDGPAHPTGCPVPAKVHLGYGFQAFRRRSPVVQTPRCRAANWVLGASVVGAAGQRSASAAKLWLCREEFAAKAGSYKIT